MEIYKECLAKKSNTTEKTIQQHCDEVRAVANILLGRFSHVLDNFKHLWKMCGCNKKEEFTSFLLEIIHSHDYGKVNPHFQQMIRENKPSKNQAEHSVYSYYLWLHHQLDNERKWKVMSNEVKTYRSLVAYGVIVGHHGEMKELFERFYEKGQTRANSEKQKVDSKKIKKLSEEWKVIQERERKLIVRTHQTQGIILRRMESELASDDTLSLMKFLFSVLVTSDGIASSDIFPNGYEEEIDYFFGRNIYKSSFSKCLKKSKNYCRTQEVAHLCSEPFEDKNGRHINEIRSMVSLKSAAAYEEGKDIYILEAPVGTGKTEASLNLAEKIIRKDGKRKLISVFPLNSVQTQYVDTLQEQIKIPEELMNVINSESIFGMERGETEEKGYKTSFSTSDGWLLERSHFSHPIIVTSHVRFFDTFTSCSRGSALGFLGLIDSVVVIDEFQNYPTHYWYGIWSELLRFSRLFGTKWIFTSGTFPVSFSQLLEGYGSKVKRIFNEREREELFSSQSVKNRCGVVTLTENRFDKHTLDQLSQMIYEDILLQHKKGQNQFLVTLSVVKHARFVFDELKNKVTDLGFTILFLCGRHSRSYKKAIAIYVKAINKNEDLKLLLVTTKTVECGMDFDFHYGYKEYDRFDSVEQLLGRINRSQKRDKTNVSVFFIDRKKFDEEKYYNDIHEQELELLREKKFDELYEELYKKNSMNILDEEKKWFPLHMYSSIEAYRKKMVIIEENDYLQTIFLVGHDEQLSEERFHSIISNIEKPSAYSERVQYRLTVQNALEPFQLTCTTKWLKQCEKENLLIEEERGGLLYYKVCHPEKFEEYLSKDELVVREEGIFEQIALKVLPIDKNKQIIATSYLERNVFGEEETFEIY